MKKVTNIKGKIIEVPNDTPCHPGVNGGLPRMLDKVADADIFAEMAEKEKAWKTDTPARVLQAIFHKRKQEYGTLEDQEDMKYHDAINGTTTWLDHITAVKANNPKPTQ